VSLRDFIFRGEPLQALYAGVPHPQTAAGSRTAIRVSGLNLPLPRVNSRPESPNPEVCNVLLLRKSKK
jgi:hypothetical protein